MEYTLPEVFRPIEEAVEDIEKRTSAEVVVVLAPWSGSYRDAELGFATLVSWLFLVFFLLSPWWFDEFFILVYCAVLIPILVWGSSRLPFLRRYITRPERRQAQVEAVAEQAYTREQVTATQGRTGILVFLSLGEEEARIRADYGIQTYVPEAQWKALENQLSRCLSEPGWLEESAKLLRKVGDLLEPHLPIQEGDVDELPNAVRVWA